NADHLTLMNPAFICRAIVAAGDCHARARQPRPAASSRPADRRRLERWGAAVGEMTPCNASYPMQRRRYATPPIRVPVYRQVQTFAAAVPKLCYAGPERLPHARRQVPAGHLASAL